MYIAPIMMTSLSQVKVANKNNIQKADNNFSNTNISKDTYTPAFTGYGKVIAEAVSTQIKRESAAIDRFDALMKNVIESSDITKQAEFGIIENIYNRNGFLGLARALRIPHPDDIGVSILLKKSGRAFNPMVLAQKNGKPVLEFTNWGKFGLFGAQDSPRDFSIIFRDESGKYSMKYYFNKKGELKTLQCGNNFSIENTYYLTTGHRRKEIYTGVCSSERTFYNKDGSENILKTLLFGCPVMW